jgi:diketogulonate reductase-like aldo/keto reductase
MKALHDLVQLNKVRYLGASSMWAHELAILQHTAEKNNWTKFVSMQNHYNLIYREEEREMIKYCNRTGVGLIPVSWSIVQESHTDILKVGPTSFGKACKASRRAKTLFPRHQWHNI